MNATRSLSNRYLDFQLFNLRPLIHGSARRGPYLVMQEGSDPTDPQLREASFVLTRRGTWIHIHIYFALPEEVRGDCSHFETVAEVFARAETLSDHVVVEDAESLPELLREIGVETELFSAN